MLICDTNANPLMPIPFGNSSSITVHDIEQIVLVSVDKLGFIQFDIADPSIKPYPLVTLRIVFAGFTSPRLTILVDLDCNEYYVVQGPSMLLQQLTTADLDLIKTHIGQLGA